MSEDTESATLLSHAGYKCPHCNVLIDGSDFIFHYIRRLEKTIESLYPPGPKTALLKFVSLWDHEERDGLEYNLNLSMADKEVHDVKVWNEEGKWRACCLYSYKTGSSE